MLGHEFFLGLASPFKKPPYQAIGSLEDLSDTEENMTNVKLHLLSEPRPSLSSRGSHKSSHLQSRRTCCIYWALIVGLLCNGTLLMVNLWGFGQGVLAHRQAGRDFALAKTSFYSPILHKVDLGLHVETINGSLFNLPSDNPGSIFRQRPSPAVDAAWDRLSKVRWILIDRSDVIRLGKDPSLAVQAPQSWNMSEKYISEIDGQHQLHCLNELRMAAYSWYYHPDSEKRHPLYWTHVSHCIDILRQNLVCQANVDMVTMNWVETQRNPYPDFSVKHVCRNHEALLEWQEENQALADELPWFEKPADANELPMHEDYFRLYPHAREKGGPELDHSSHSHTHGV